ncbi:PREDICTED: NAC domain-containing protein 83 [Tarenaya hassleriana]|uniref:NAC domain-containing protein 83 n=1 Tax=Tarenaya hassleriana TaxID=28532 RepID=UPI00053C2D14|nr:PREDICTED: NAC domain-containing protein 83 [Tarenaya hassleriana]XP_019057928.1 PREDICTED: NAC domain-containing protein 83 [Tarenaya hassleriana]
MKKKSYHMDISMQRFVVNGRTVRLPPGFRFHPEEEDLVFEYLAKKVLNRPMDFNLPEIESYNADPWDLLGEKNNEAYFFAKKQERERKRRETDSGYWEECEEEMEMEARDQNNYGLGFKGMKKTFVFFIGKRSRGSITPWLMHEFRLVYVANARSPCPIRLKDAIDKWRAIKVFAKSDESEEEEMEEDDFTASDESDGEEVVQNGSVWW